MKWAALPLAGAMLAGVALAEDPAPATVGLRAEASAQVAVTATANATVSATGFLLSLRLPTLAHETRRMGVPNEDVKVALTSMQEAKLPPEDAIATFKAAVASIDEKGPVENFGAFVQSKVKAGVRGPELAKAIREEHEKRGIGRGKKLTKDDEHPGKHLGQDPEAKALHMEGKGKAEDRTGKGPGSADPPGKGAEKANDKGSTGADKAAKPAAAGPEGKRGGPPVGKHEGHGQSKDEGKGK